MKPNTDPCRTNKQQNQQKQSPIKSASSNNITQTKNKKPKRNPRTSSASSEESYGMTGQRGGCKKSSRFAENRSVPCSRRCVEYVNDIRSKESDGIGSASGATGKHGDVQQRRGCKIHSRFAEIRSAPRWGRRASNAW
jgi:hypothetical protein